MGFSILNPRFVIGLCLLLPTLALDAAPLLIRVAHIDALVEVAATPQAREQGLMFRTTLDKDSGMLFVFPQQRLQRIWMRDTLIPLDVGFFDRDGILINVITMRPDNGKQIHTSALPATYALEMNSGWFERHGLAAGSRLILPFSIEAE